MVVVMIMVVNTLFSHQSGKGGIRLEKDLLYDKYTLQDTYLYNKNVERSFQWDKARYLLNAVEAVQRLNVKWGMLQNYKNIHGVAPDVKKTLTDNYHSITDTLGIPRNQSIPLYKAGDRTKPVRYGRDGSLIVMLGQDDQFVRIKLMTDENEWLVPERYVKATDSTSFKKAILVDRKNQNIATMERTDAVWLIRSMNPATTGLKHPPFMRETPVGIFVVQNKVPRMNYTQDGSSAPGGYAPYASRFTDGAYIHGVPVNYPHTQMVEYAQTLGTTPRSHMCVRNATSHAKFIYDWAPAEGTLVFVVD
jgi:hypothetical protein